MSMASTRGRSWRRPAISRVAASARAGAARADGGTGSKSSGRYDRASRNVRGMGARRGAVGVLGRRGRYDGAPADGDRTLRPAQPVGALGNRPGRREPEEASGVAAQDRLAVLLGHPQLLDEAQGGADGEERPVRSEEEPVRVTDVRKNALDALPRLGEHPGEVRELRGPQEPGGVRVDVLVLVDDLGRFLDPWVPQVAEDELDVPVPDRHLIDLDGPGELQAGARVHGVSLVDHHGEAAPRRELVDGVEAGIVRVEREVARVA